MINLILNEGLRDYILLESNDNINSLSLYADQLIEDNVDPKLEVYVSKILNVYLESNLTLFEVTTDIKKEVNDLSQGKGPLNSLKRKLGTKNLGKLIKDKLINSKDKIKSKIKKAIKAGLGATTKNLNRKKQKLKKHFSKYKSILSQLNKTARDFSGEAEYKKWQNTDAMKLKSKAAIEKRKFNKMRDSRIYRMQKKVNRKL